MIDDNNEAIVKKVSGVKYKLLSINCKKCGEKHPLAEGMGDGSLYWCGEELLKIGDGDDINMDFGC